MVDIWSKLHTSCLTVFSDSKPPLGGPCLFILFHPSHHVGLLPFESFEWRRAGMTVQTELRRVYAQIRSKAIVNVAWLTDNLDFVVSSMDHPI